MQITIDLSDKNAATLELQPQAAHMPKESYLKELVEQALQHQPAQAEHGNRPKPKKSAYGLLS